MNTSDRESLHPTVKLLRVTGEFVRRSQSTGSFYQNHSDLPPRYHQNRRSRSANSVLHLPLQAPPHNASSFKPNSDLLQEQNYSAQDGGSEVYGVRLLRVTPESEFPMTFRGSEVTPQQSPLLQLEPPQRLDPPNFHLIRSRRMEQLYKAKIARVNEELRFFRAAAKRQGHYELSKSLPDVSMTGEVSALKLTIAQLEREQIDLLRLVLHLRGRLKQVSKENVELASKAVEASEAAETSKRQLAMADAARGRAVEEMESLKTRFADALRDHELQQRAALSNTLNKSDTRLEVIKASLLLAEKKTAEASARASHVEAQLTDLTNRLQASEAENKCLREENRRLIEESKKSLASANIQSERALKKLTHFQEQANLDEDAMRNSISMLRSQLHEALERAEKSQTELILANEAQVRLLSRSNALEQRLQQVESDLATANACHEEEMREVKDTAEAGEARLRSALEQLTHLYETRMSHAEDLFNQQHRLLKKLREECRYNVEAFDLTVSQMDRRQQLLLNEAQEAREIAALNEEERDRLHNETVEHLTQADCLARQVSQLEQTLSDKNSEIGQLNDKHQKLVRDARVLAKEVKYLQNQLSQYVPEKEKNLFDRCIIGSHEVQKVIARVEKFPT
uniref:Serologically defined colon cancer antigen 8 n=1 Tax=Echinococcus granulosus TaxID=6210 RepID=A0A068WQA5_ECHGR|nr:hypothetical protein EgrG_000197500 [Echinococcus granulosus]